MKGNYKPVTYFHFNIQITIHLVDNQDDNDTDRNVFDKVIMLSSTKDLQKEEYDDQGKLL